MRAHCFERQPATNSNRLKPRYPACVRAEEASRAYFEAAQSDDEKALLDILGPAGKDLIFSGDSAEDENSRIEFVVRFLEMHRLAAGPDGTATLYIGTDGLPMPIPLVNKAERGISIPKPARKKSSRDALERTKGRPCVAAVNWSRRKRCTTPGTLRTAPSGSLHRGSSARGRPYGPVLAGRD